MHRYNIDWEKPQSSCVTPAFNWYLSDFLKSVLFALYKIDKIYSNLCLVKHIIKFFNIYQVLNVKYHIGIH